MQLPVDAATKILNSTSDAIVVVDADGRIVFANLQAMFLFGYPIEELIGNKIEMLIPAEARGKHERYRRRYNEAPRARPLVSGLSLKAQHKSGRKFDAEIALLPLDTDGSGLIATSIREIDADADAEALFRHLLDAAPDAMVIVDEKGKISIVNVQAERMFGYTRDQMVGRSVEMLMPERYRERHIAHQERYNTRRRLREMGLGMELAGQRRDGTEFPVEISLSPMWSASGWFITSVIQDVTEQQRLEHDLVSARQAAERANKANTAFLTAASHDLRQPVQALYLLNGALRRTVKNPLAMEMLESQQDSLDAMTALLNSLLDISRLDAGAIEPEIEEFSVKRVLDRLSAEFRRQAQHKGLVFEAEHCEAAIRSDPNLLGQIIQNFVSNAVRYTDRGAVSLKCSEQDGMLRISVSDTGIGIEPDQFDNIFREFHQIKRGARNSGFGLGLAIVRRLADLLGHEIRVESSVGRGSCFSVVLPLARSAQSAGTVRREPPPAASAAASSGLVILIEDDDNVAAAWGQLLQSEGYRVAIARSASEARAVVGSLKERPRLIVSDFHLLDESTGIDAVVGVRRCLGACIPAFIVTGDTSKIMQQAESLENSIVMSKPVSTDRLLQFVKVAVASGVAPD
jgi:two-component system, sensor histidine kinase